MKATTIALDFVKDIDGTFKVLELNTDVGFWPISQSAYTNVETAVNYISQSGVTGIHYIGSNTYGARGQDQYNLSTDEFIQPDSWDMGLPVFKHIKQSIKDEYLAQEEIDSGSYWLRSWNDHFVTVGGSSIPFVNDTSDVMIIRNAYDNTALVDTEYSANTTNFLKLVRDYCTGSNALSFPATYVAPSGSEEAPLDTLSSADFRYNNHHPNYIIKKVSSGVHADNVRYPKLYHVSSSADLQTLKDGLQEGELLQEYIYNHEDLDGGRLKTYRATGWLAGSNLDSVHFFDPYVVTNILPVYHDVVDYDSTGSIKTLEAWERPAYVQKISNGAVAYLQPNAVEGMKGILHSDGSEIDLHFQEVGTVLKTIDLVGLIDDESNAGTYSGSFVDGSTDLGSFSSGSIVSNESGDTISIGVRYHLEGGETFDTQVGALHLIVDNDDKVRFSDAALLESGSRLAGFDPTTGAVTSVGIVSAKRYIHTKQLSHIDVEEEDTFLVKGSGPLLFLVHNNTCNCYSSSGYCFASSDCLSNPYQCSYYPGCVSFYPYCYSGPTYYGTYGCSGGAAKT